jgi:hypothetical protein
MAHADKQKKLTEDEIFAKFEKENEEDKNVHEEVLNQLGSTSTPESATNDVEFAHPMNQKQLTIPNYCLVWNDGCNDCLVDEKGDL